MFWRPMLGSANDCSGRFGVGVLMSAEQVERACALAVGFAIAGCWSLTSGMIVALALSAFGGPGG
jgi:hypothetical protein